MLFVQSRTADAPERPDESALEDPGDRWLRLMRTERRGVASTPVDKIGLLLKCPAYRENVTLLHGRLAAKFWRCYDLINVVVDRLERGQTAESLAWRGDVAVAHGFRWIAIGPEGITPEDLKALAGRSAT